ncbi:MAG TPA: protein kinase, partial [Thermoanaerobaculia bacterium]|nr:protein kinase [Thermoanaerobaculia bacterium]
MNVSVGSRLGPYEIVSRIGAGGMGEVWRATDTRLDRSVAIKVLPAEFAQNAQMKARFEREAKTISQLNHPNICSLYDIGHDSGTDFLVMELLEGETLAERLDKGALPLTEVLRYGAQIADALARAHRQGVMHRDLKPGNVMLSRSAAKLLDFGLAKTLVPVQPVSAPDDATQQKPLTQEGTILGTFQYMAPEQLAGEEADARTDIFALGAVLYEMATGKRAFEGKTRTSLIAAIIASDPRPISEIQPLTPPAFEHVVQKCLSKDREDRWQSAHDVAEELTWISGAGSKAGAAAPIVARQRTRQRLQLASAALLLAAITGVAGFAIANAHRAKAETLRALVASPELDAAVEELETGFALSPDGKMLAYVGIRNGVALLFIRSLDRFDSRALAGTEGASFPFWSPDNSQVGFFAELKLKRIVVAGGEPQTVSDAEEIPRGGTWNRDGVILFAPGPRSGLLRVSAGGGPAVPATILESRNEASHRWPAFLPDGRHFLYYVMGDKKGIYLGSLDSHQRTRIVDGGSNPLFVSPGVLLFVRDRDLVAQRFDTSHFRLIGEPVSVAEDIGQFGEDGPTGYGRFSASDTGVVAFQKISLMTSQLVWRDRSGAELGRLGPPGSYMVPILSRDATRVVINRTDPKTRKTDLWSEDLTRGVYSRLTTGPGQNTIGLWSPDGKQIVFSSNRNGVFDFYIKTANGGGDERPLFASPLSKFADDWSADGRFIVYEQFTPKTYNDLWMLDLSSHKATPVLTTEFDELHAQFSPDGKWLAYTCSESGKGEVYVQSFPPSGDKWQVSTTGGDQAVWSRDQKKIYYVAPDHNLFEVEIATAPTFRIGKAAA